MNCMTATRPPYSKRRSMTPSKPPPRRSTSPSITSIPNPYVLPTQAAALDARIRHCHRPIPRPKSARRPNSATIAVPNTAATNTTTTTTTTQLQKMLSFTNLTSGTMSQTNLLSSSTTGSVDVERPWCCAEEAEAAEMVRHRHTHVRDLLRALRRVDRTGTTTRRTDCAVSDSNVFTVKASKGGKQKRSGGSSVPRTSSRRRKNRADKTNRDKSQVQASNAHVGKLRASMQEVRDLFLAVVDARCAMEAQRDMFIEAVEHSMGYVQPDRHRQHVVTDASPQEDSENSAAATVPDECEAIDVDEDNNGSRRRVTSSDGSSRSERDLQATQMDLSDLDIQSHDVEVLLDVAQTIIVTSSREQLQSFAELPEEYDDYDGENEKDLSPMLVRQSNGFSPSLAIARHADFLRQVLVTSQQQQNQQHGGTKNAHNGHGANGHAAPSRQPPLASSLTAASPLLARQGRWPWYEATLARLVAAYDNRAQGLEKERARARAALQQTLDEEFKDMMRRVIALRERRCTLATESERTRAAKAAALSKLKASNDRRQLEVLAMYDSLGIEERKREKLTTTIESLRVAERHAQRKVSEMVADEQRVIQQQKKQQQQQKDEQQQQQQQQQQPPRHELNTARRHVRSASADYSGFFHGWPHRPGSGGSGRRRFSSSNSSIFTLDSSDLPPSSTRLLQLGDILARQRHQLGESIPCSPKTESGSSICQPMHPRCYHGPTRVPTCSASGRSSASRRSPRSRPASANPSATAAAAGVRRSESRRHENSLLSARRQNPVSLHDLLHMFSGK